MEEQPEFLLNGPVRNLSRIFRFSSMPIHEPENVAEHTFWVCWYSMQIAHWYLYFNDSTHSQANFRIVNMKILYEMAIIHDIGECFTGDMIRPVKYSSPQFLEAYRAMEAEGLVELGEQLPEPVLEATNRALNHKETKKSSIEVRILRLADLLSVWGKLVEEANLGNRYALEELQNSLDSYAEEFQEDPDLGPLFSMILPTISMSPSPLIRWPKGH